MLIDKIVIEKQKKVEERKDYLKKVENLIDDISRRY